MRNIAITILNYSVNIAIEHNYKDPKIVKGYMVVWYRSHIIPFILTFMAIMIIATGAWIRVNDAGESCPDWPQCFGTWGFDVSEEEQAEWWEEHPEEIDSRGAEHRYTSSQIFTEWLHRLLVGAIGLFVIYSHFTAWSLREEIGDRVYQLHSIATFLLVLQAIVGAITVDMDNAPWTVAMHLSLALFFTSSLIAVGFYWWEKQSKLPENIYVSNVTDEIRKIVGIVGLIVLFQLVVGAFLSSGYHRSACGIGFMDGWPLCGGKIIPEFNQAGVSIQFIHRFFAIIISGILLWANRKIKSEVENSVVTGLMHSALALYNVNLLLGGWYIISAGQTSEAVFSNHIGLTHSLLGSLTFLILITIYFIFVISIQRTNKG